MTSPALVPAWPFLDDVLSGVRSGKNVPVQVASGLPYFCLRLALAGQSLFFVTDEEKAETFSEDLKAFQTLFDPLRERSVGFVPEHWTREKSVLLEESLQLKGVVWFGTEASLKEPCFSRPEFKEARLDIRVGKPLPHQGFLNRLALQGYHRADSVEEIGEFAQRGEVLDFWSPNHDKPIRLVYSGDQVESLHFFDTFSQRTVQFLPEAVLLPVSAGPATGSLSDHFPVGSILVRDGAAAEPVSAGPFPCLDLAGSGPDSGLAPVTPVRLNWKLFSEELEKNAQAGRRSFVFCRNVGESQRLEDILDEMHCPKARRPDIVIAALSRGFLSRDLNLCVWSFNDLTGQAPVVRRLPKFKSGYTLGSIAELKSGDYVVHEAFGVGRYRGLERMSLKAGGRRGREKVSEFLALEYRGGDRLLVPIQDFRLVQKYVGAEGKKPQLYSLDGIAWERVKQKIRGEIQDIARDLLETAAQRAGAVRGEDAGGDARREHLYREFCGAFPYEETPDQALAIAEVEKDLNSRRLMDRLVCGDVGYGKTEVAMRAAFKSVLDSRQVAVLVPTTILAEQHYQNFCSRFAAFPVKIAMISRFQKRADQLKTVEALKRGLVDVVVGTHRLIQKDVAFKNLGLIVIDEEHRFGVQQKEALKKLKLNADVLTLSATPIPRTLSLSFGGVKQISVIETPPEGRLPIETHVGPHSEEMIKEALSRELGRGGQVFYVCNRVAALAARKERLEKLFPGLRVGTAHGQMSADALEKAMWQFLSRKWDVLISTTIIESGLDIPSVNTLIVEDSDDFGLSQLYQLRGRVGRQREKAWCYLFFSEWGGLSQEARKRLDAIREFSALGSGMKLALRDMEIRGTGNLLGEQQHGWVNAVGLDLYCQMLSEEIDRLRTERGLPGPETERPGAAEPLTEIELNIDALIPETYVESPGERIVLYKRMAACRSDEELQNLRAEFADRFGPPPEPVLNLFGLLDLKLRARCLKMTSLTESEQGFVCAWAETGGGVAVDVFRLARDRAALVEVLPIDPQTRPPCLRILFKWDAGDALFEGVKNLLKIISEYVNI